jgi:mxaA protein
MKNLRVQILKCMLVIAFSFYAGMSSAKPKDEIFEDVSIDRTWGLVLGDDVTVNVDLSQMTQKIDTSSLPQEQQRYGSWLYLKSVKQTAKQLLFNYMIINVPMKNTMIETPTFDVKKDDDTWITLTSSFITIGPSLAVEKGASNIEAKPNIKPTLISTADTEQQRIFAIIIALVSSLILALWHFGWKTKHRQPFAQAVHDLSRFRLHAATADEAARILHTAFNGTAGTVVVYGKLEALFVDYPWLQTLQADIEQFYQQSEQHFFARNSQQGLDIDTVRKIAKACRAKEMLA